MNFGKADALKRQCEAGHQKFKEEVSRLRDLLRNGTLSPERRSQIHKTIDRLIGVKETQIKKQNGGFV